MSIPSKAQKRVAVVIAIMIIIAIFSACTPASSDPSQAANSGASPAASASAGASSAAPAEEPVIKVLWTKGGFEAPPTDNDIIKERMIQDSGVKFELISPPREHITEQLHLIMASKDLPDIAEINLKPDVFMYNEEGLLLDLEPYKDLMPAINELIPQTAMDYFKVDGKQIAIPKWTSTKRYNVYVRQDWLDKLNLEVPVTLDDYHNVLTAFVNNDPDGNGVKDTYGINGDGLDGLGFVFGAFGVVVGEAPWIAPDVYASVQFKEIDGKLVPYATLPEAKEALTVLNQWYSEGLIDPEFPAQKAGQLDEKFEKNRYGMGSCWWTNEAKLEAKMKTVNPDTHVTRIAPPVGPTGISGNRAVGEVVCGVSVISSTKYPEECVKFLDYLHTETGMMTSYTGVEGVHWEKTADGKFLTLPQFDVDNKFIQWYFLFENEQPLYKVETYLAPSRREALQWNVIRNAGDGLLTPAESKYGGDLGMFMASTFVKFIKGEKPLSEFDSFVEEFNANGGTEWANEITEAYAAKKASQ